MKRVAVIGGGAAGMTAAYSASLCNDTDVYLFEKNNVCGKKMLITGKGRCNITNIGDIDVFMENIPHNSLFLYSALSQYCNYDVISALNENDLKTKIERGGRVFPESDRAADIVDWFVNMLKKQNVTIMYEHVLKKIEKSNYFSLTFENGTSFLTDSVIVATGGISYPKTGSTGDGYKVAKSMGHSVTKLYPSLAPLKTAEMFVKDLTGLTLKNIAISVKDEAGQVVYSDFGELLFTHFGVSGPVILSASARITERLNTERFLLVIDLKPALDQTVLDKRLLKDFGKYKNKDVINALNELLPKSLIPVIIESSGIEPQKKVNNVTKAERAALCKTIKELTLTITGTDGFNHAVITRGGINTNEINPKTMESKIIKGLFFAGELIDVDGYTGGFNLQIAFSTGYAAGKYASKS